MSLEVTIPFEMIARRLAADPTEARQSGPRPKRAIGYRSTHRSIADLVLVNDRSVREAGRRNPRLARLAHTIEDLTINIGSWRGCAGALCTVALVACGGSTTTSTDATRWPPTSSTAIPTSIPPTSSTTVTTSSPPITPAPPVTRADDALPKAQSIGETAGVVAIDAEPFPDWVTIAGDSAWVANVDHGVARYDLTTGTQIGTVPTGTSSLPG